MIELKKVRLLFLLSSLLIVGCLSVFWQTLDHDFVNFDDPQIYKNKVIHQGFSKESLKWAFKVSSHNWIPLTRISHILDCELYGLDPKKHHLSNLLFHSTSSVILFLTLYSLTYALGRSFFVAALFAIHPLHVESVAWISERKDVLSGLLWMLTIWTYGRYVKSPSTVTWIPVFVCFALGLMAKPMLVTLPCVLLLLDYWPLLRIKGNELKKWGKAWSLIWEKKSLFLLALLSCGITLSAQDRARNLIDFKIRLANAAISYIDYIGKMIWPTHLAVFYPHPISNLSILTVAIYSSLLLFATIWVLSKSRCYPYLTVGLFWYLGTLVPVIGILQVGGQAMADRYTYLPLVGLFIAIVWGINDCVQRFEWKMIWPGFAGGIVILVLTGVAWKQTQMWKNTKTLFQHALDVVPNNYLAYLELGTVALKQKKYEIAIPNFRQAVRIRPDLPMTHYNLGNAYSKREQNQAAIASYSNALALDPFLWEGHLNLGAVWFKLYNLQKAQTHFEEALKIYPKAKKAHYDLGLVLIRKHQLSAAVHRFEQALGIDPNFVEAYNNLGMVQVTLGRTQEAFNNYRNALRLDPNSARVHFNLANLLAKEGQLNQAEKHYVRSLKIDPAQVDVQHNIAIALIKMGRYDEAVVFLKKSLELKADYPPSLKALNKLLREKMVTTKKRSHS